LELEMAHLVINGTTNSSNTNTGGISIVGATNNSYTPPTNTVGTNIIIALSAKTALLVVCTSATAAIIVISAPTITQPLKLCLPRRHSNYFVYHSKWLLLELPSINGIQIILITQILAAISGETNSTYTPSASTVGTIYYCIITLTSGGCSSITSNTATVTINAGSNHQYAAYGNSKFMRWATIVTLTITYTGGTGTVITNGIPIPQILQ
jgi:hypothetical protein